MTTPDPAVRRAIDNVLVAGSHLLPYIGAGHPPASAETADGLRHYGGQPCPAFDCWMAWRGMERLSEAWAGWLAEIAASEKERAAEAAAVMP